MSQPAKGALHGFSGHSLWLSAVRSTPSAVVIGVATFFGYAFHLNYLTVSFIYLLVVVSQSLTGDFLSSVLVSLIAFLCLDFFFIPPLFSLAVSDPSEALALISFLVIGLAITRLTSRARTAAVSAAAQRAETTRLYELAQELLLLPPEMCAGTALLGPFKSRFNLGAVCLFDPVDAETYLEGTSIAGLPDKTRTAYIKKQDFQESESRVAVRLLLNRGNIIGAIGFEGLVDIELTCEPLAGLAALMIERARAFREASHAAAAAEAETLRGAVLDALAHEFKTPLATIITAAGGLREAGQLESPQRDLADIVESEASRLGQLTSRLLRLARLERDEVKPQMEVIDLARVVSAVATQYAARWPERRLVTKVADGFFVLGDEELLWLGLGQLLDNACKYSKAGSDVDVSVSAMNESFVVRVCNSGSPIPKVEQARVFDRFYRGADAHRKVPGSGLGLYVARKIALAHGGNLELEPGDAGGGTVFRFSVPMARESGDGRKAPNTHR